MTQVLGVDFSGERGDRNTWLTQGQLDGNCLWLSDCRWVSRSELADVLAKCVGPTVAALDFPFALPAAFAHHWQPEASAMPDLWAAAEQLDLPGFIALRNELVARRSGLPSSQREPKRVCDPPESYSCLHMVNPNMVPMTLRGMQLLHRLWTGNTANPIEVPPMPYPSRAPAGETTVLLEVMPGAVLRRLGGGSLPFKGYKGGRRAVELRQVILDQLPLRAAPLGLSLEGLAALCLANHDALDSVVAAVAAALWVSVPGRFLLPSPEQHTLAMLEGWLYAPTAAIGEA